MNSFVLPQPPSNCRQQSVARPGIKYGRLVIKDISDLVELYDRLLSTEPVVPDYDGTE